MDIAKKIMFDFYYDVVKKIFPESTLLMTDTDSLLFEVSYEGDINEVLKANEKYFDFSNLPENHRLFDPTRANRPALFKIDDPNLKLFIGLCAKVYWLSGSEDIAKGKGAVQALRQKMTGKHYLNALREPMTLSLGDAPAIPGQMGPVTSIRSRNHEVTTETSSRVGFVGLQTKMERVGPFEFLPFLSYYSSSL